MHTARRAANVGGRSGVGGAVCHFVCEEVFSGAFEEAMRWCACAVIEASDCLLVHAILCSVQRKFPRSKCG